MRVAYSISPTEKGIQPKISCKASENLGYNLLEK